MLLLSIISFAVRQSNIEGLTTEFPDKAIPKELFIEDKRYKVEITKQEEHEKSAIKHYEEMN